MRAEVWDSRRCKLGEGPISINTDNEMVLWVDITGQKVLWKGIRTGESGERFFGVDTSFVIPCKDGCLVIGTSDGPTLLDQEGNFQALPTREEADGRKDSVPIRWNDAKVSPDGDLWLGSMAYGGKEKVGGLYKLTKDAKTLTRKLSGIRISNGLAWSRDSRTLFFIDTPTSGVDAFDYENGEISRRRQVFAFDAESEGWPDGMTIDAEDGLWVALWGGSCVKRLDSKYKLTETIELPNKFISSCAFAGSDLKTLIITTAMGDGDSWDDHDQAGMTYAVRLEVPGRPTLAFG